MYASPLPLLKRQGKVVRFRYRVTYSIIQRVAIGHIRRKVTTYYKQLLHITVVKPIHPWAIADDVMIKLTFDDYPELLK